MPFVLLDLLARAEGDWVDDEELKSKLWGRRGAIMSRSALHTLIYNTRRIFYGWGLDGLCIEKDRGRVRLAVASVERVGA
jgi:DNA-binding winged helix-turn-helix (wHTH) protein